VRTATPLIVWLILGVSSATADTIVLKNGRRIVAENVTQDGDRVTYQTPAGQLSIPKSIVARVDHDDSIYSSASAASGSSSEPPVSAPQVEVRGYEEVAALAVHDDSIDYKYLSSLESDARSHSMAAIARVSAAHYAVAQFLLGKGDTDSAIDQYRQALVLDPQNSGLLLNLAVLYLRQSQFTEALDPLERARRVAPDSADVAKLTGWAYYGANKIPQAIEEWKRAERLRPDSEVEQALQKAERDKAEEESYREGETAHFDLKYNGEATPDLARGILRALEDDFRDLESQLDYTPPEQIGVILYTEQAFADITRAPGWVGALNDGRLRVPVQGLRDVTPELARVLKHELTHSFVGQKSHGRAPTWLQEGAAQWMEGRRSSSVAAALVDAVSQGAAPAFPSLDGSWMGLSANSAAFAYAWSLAVVESIIDAGGVSDLSRLLDRVATSASTESALQETLHMNYADLAQQTLAYLRHTYVR
jgi:tetratricopeptide (TPR) repeat protein